MARSSIHPSVKLLFVLGKDAQSFNLGFRFCSFIEQLKSPPFSSTDLLNSSKLVSNPHHGIWTDRNRFQIIGVDLPAFLLSKSVIPDPVRVPSIPLEDFASCFSCFATWKEIPCGTSNHSSLATNHCCKIKNPASSAGYSHPH